jgi:hypothetical protein
MVEYEALETAFLATIEKNRRGKTMQPCSREALSAPAFFYPSRPASIAPGPTQMLRTGVDGASFVPNKIPFDLCWIVTDFKGLGIVALAERNGDFVRPDYLWYPVPLHGHRIMTTEAETDQRASYCVDRAIFGVTHNRLEHVETDAWRSVNAGRARAKNDPLPPLPAFIRVTDECAPVAGYGAEHRSHASPQGHERRGHYRNLRNGRRVWIREMSVCGGSIEPRFYRA